MMLFGQTFDPGDLGTIGLLVLLEAVLSVDNALVLGLVAGKTGPQNAGKVLRYGLAGAFIFRVIVVVLAGFLLRWPSLKLLGAAYLIYLSVRRFIFEKTASPLAAAGKSIPLWRSIIDIELTDMAFAVDNVLAAVALVGPPPPGWPAGHLHPKLWVILVGGMLGVILMRFAASFCVRLLRRFPRLDASADVIIFLVACKLALEWCGLDFQNPRQPPFWIFWCFLAACLAVGFIPRRPRSVAIPPGAT